MVMQTWRGERASNSTAKTGLGQKIWSKMAKSDTNLSQSQIPRMPFYDWSMILVLVHIFWFLVDCQLSNWGPCDKTCGQGLQKRTITVHPKDGGQACDTLSQTCNIKECAG